MPTKKSKKKARKQGKKPVRKKAARRKKTAQKKAWRAKPAIRKKKTARRKRITRRTRAIRGRTAGATAVAVIEEQGLGSEAAGQSGDIQGLAHQAGADSESVEELAEEGQAFEAEVISGVENVPDADVAEVTTREVPEDDVPPEYRETED